MHSKNNNGKPTSPLPWPRVIGQRRVKEALLSALQNNRLPHAYIFFGNDGVGKDAMAIELARVLHCEKGQPEPCGICISCHKLDQLQHPDVRFIVALPVGKGEKSDDGPLAKLNPEEIDLVREQLRLKSENPYYRVMIPKATVIKINSIREVRRESSMSTNSGRRRVFIISHADMMEDPAANTILKTLEEPSGNTMLILTTAHRDALLPTILSRCQGVQFDPLTEQEISAALIERNGVEPKEASLVARLANGSFGHAQDLLQEDLAKQRLSVLAFVRNVLGTNLTSLTEQIEELSSTRDRDVVTRFLNLLLMWFRDALVLSQGGDVINLDQREEIKRFTTKFPHANLVQVLSDVERAIFLVERNVYIKLIFLQLAVKLRKNIQIATDAGAMHTQRTIQ